jgi:triacylglycerol lipase
MPRAVRFRAVSRPRLAILPLAAALALLLPASATAAGEELEVPWTFDAGIAAQQTAPNSPPAGANDFSCKPSRRHDEPVILAHGLMANQTVNWATISPYLANRNFCVFSLTYGTREEVKSGSYQPGGLKRMQQSARELKRFVKKVLERTGAEKVDIVGHSEGSLMPSWYVRFLGGARKVDDYVGLTTLWEGTNPAGLDTMSQIADTFGIGGPMYDAVDEFCLSCRQFLSSSEFFKELHGRGTFSPKVTYTSIVTKNDELVFPYTSGLAPEGPNQTNVVLQDYCKLDQAEHMAVAADPVTAGFIYRALDPKRAPDPPCTVVLPGIGAPGYNGN